MSTSSNSQQLLSPFPTHITNHINAFIDTTKLKNSSKTTYIRQLNIFATWLQKENITEPTEQTIRDYYNHLNQDKNLSDLSLNGYLTTLKSFFAWLNSVNIYPDIAKNISGPEKILGLRKESLTSNQVTTLLNAIDRSSLNGKRDFALINLMVRTGLRCSEIIHISRGDVAHCCSTQLLWIEEKITKGKNDHIPLPDSLFNPLQEYLDARKSTSDTEPLFASHSKKNFGQPLTIRSISRIIKNRLKAVHIDDKRISADSLRYTAIRLNLLAWATMEQANNLIRTADINTMLVYTRRLKHT